MRMVVGFGLLIVVCACATVGQSHAYEGARHQKVIYPDGTIRLEPVTTAAPSPVAENAIQSLNCCKECGDTECKGCSSGLNLPKITSAGGAGCKDEDCEDIKPKVEGKLKEECEKQPFYEKCEDEKREVDIPVIVCREVETIRFTTLNVADEKCCKFTVCIPCERCLTCERTCELRPTKDIDVRICRRPSGTYDVYVLNVPGMPTEWLLFLDAQKADVEAKLGPVSF
jgi:hypothetical protein